MDDSRLDRGLRFDGLAQGLERPGHGRVYGLRRFALDHPQDAARGEKEIDFQTLTVAEMIQLFSVAPVHLKLEDLRGHEPFEQSAQKRRSIQLRLGADAQKVT